MAETTKITEQDVYIKARLLTEGVRIKGYEPASFKEQMKSSCEIPMPEKLDAHDVEEIMRLQAASMESKSNFFDVLSYPVTLDSSLRAPLFPNRFSALDCEIHGSEVTISDRGEVLAHGRIPNRPAWHQARLSNGLPLKTAVPGFSDEIINVLISLSCINMNTGRGCRYCGLFANPVSRRLVMLPKESLRTWAKYQGEAVKIATDNDWRGSLAITGGALPKAHRGEYMERLDLVLTEIRKAIGDEVFSELDVSYNQYPPEDLNDMRDWKELGIKATTIDLEVMDPAYFAALCPGKNAYKPHAYWKEAQEASVEVFGPYLHTSSCVVVGVEPMELMLKGLDERLSKGVLPFPLVYNSAPGSAYWGHRPPNADWLMEATGQMADIYLKYAAPIIKSLIREAGQKGARRLMRIEAAKARANKARGIDKPQTSSPIVLLFDEIQRRYQGKLMAAVAELAGEELKSRVQGLLDGLLGRERKNPNG